MYPFTNTKKAGARFVAAAVLATIAAACQSPDVVDSCNDRPECYRSDAANDGPRPDTRPASDAADSGQARNALCGNMGCFPGNWNACGSPVPVPVIAAFRQDDAASDATSETDVIVGGDASSDATNADAQSDSSSSDAHRDSCRDDAHGDGASPPSDASVDAGTVDASTPDSPPVDDGSSPPLDASEDSAPPTEDASVPPDSGRNDARPDLGTEEPRIAQSCYISPARTTGVTTDCAPVGARAPGSPCNDSHECGALLACVEADGKATCEYVSCSTPTCLKRSYYREVPLRANGVTRSDLPIPVCYPTDNCVLLSPGQCPEGKVCAVIGTLGDTTCVEPGSAMAGESCDDAHACAEGLLCSKAIGQCVKICRDDPDSHDCPNGLCQAGNLSLPSGFGICVGQVDGGRVDGG
ncbi:MAG: hypothetical protein ABW133_01475, partial [Polyangiaceae bacterium]